MIKVKINNFNNNLARYQFEMQKKNLDTKKINKMKKEFKLKAAQAEAGENQEDKLQRIEKEAEKFTAVFLEKMFSTMKKTLADEKLLDGGFAEDVFSDMLNKEYSQMAGKQGMLAELNQALVDQLKNANS